MPGDPLRKLKNVENLVEWFSEFAVDFDKLLPSIYRYDGQKPGRDRRANAWARVDQHVILLHDALGELQTVLRSHAMPKTCRKGEPEVEDRVTATQGSSSLGAGECPGLM